MDTRPGEKKVIIVAHQSICCAVCKQTFVIVTDYRQPLPAIEDSVGVEYTNIGWVCLSCSREAKR